jgi:hypothetical protein
MLKIKKYFSKDKPQRTIRVTMTITGMKSLDTMRNIMNLIDDGMDEVYENGDYIEENPEEYEEQVDMKRYQEALQDGLFDDSKKLIKIE